jgi:phosphoribosyl-AMP cyclohydrolase
MRYSKSPSFVLLSDGGKFWYLSQYEEECHFVKERSGHLTFLKAITVETDGCWVNILFHDGVQVIIHASEVECIIPQESMDKLESK